MGKKRRNDTQHDDTQHNDIQHNDTKHSDTQHNDTQNDDTLHNDAQENDVQHNIRNCDTQHNGIQCLCRVLLCSESFMLSVAIKSSMQSSVTRKLKKKFAQFLEKSDQKGQNIYTKA